MSLLYSCLPASAAGGAGAKSAKSGKAKSRHPAIDIHCHVFTPAAAALAKDRFKPGNDPYSLFHSAASKEVDAKQAQAIGPLLTSVAERLKVMDRDGIDIQAVSTAPIQYYYWAEAELGLQAARLINQNIASICQANPERFVGLATVPMQAPELAVRELTRAVKELGLKGVEICPHVENEELSADRFRPFWAKAEELGVLVFLHPHGFPDGRRLSSHFFSNIIGNPLDTTVAVHHLIFGGVLEDHPGLKIVLAHGGGYLPSYAGRIDHAHGARPDARSRIQKKPSSYLKKLYFDTIVFTHHQLEYLAGLYGSDHILLGTDYPFDMALPNPVGFVTGAPHLSDQDKALILGGNAARLLGIKLPARAAQAKAGSLRRRAKKK
jgi:aminocarboxymuconate-semialdehyde decarboxylase